MIAAGVLGSAWSPRDLARGVSVGFYHAVSGLVDAGAARVTGRPVHTALRVSPLHIMRGEVDGLRAVVGGVQVAGLQLHRVDLRAKRLRIVPGLPPQLRIGDLEVGVRIRQVDVDAWTRTAALPVRLRLLDAGIGARVGVGGMALGEVLADLSVVGQQFRLVPRRVAVLGVGLTNPSTALLRLVLPLPPLPASGRLVRMVHRREELEVWFSAKKLRQELSPAAVAELQRRLGRLVRLAPARRPA